MPFSTVSVDKIVNNWVKGGLPLRGSLLGQNGIRTRCAPTLNARPWDKSGSVIDCCRQTLLIPLDADSFGRTGGRKRVKASTSKKRASAGAVPPPGTPHLMLLTPWCEPEGRCRVSPKISRRFWLEHRPKTSQWLGLHHLRSSAVPCQHLQFRCLPLRKELRR